MEKTQLLSQKDGSEAEKEYIPDTPEAFTMPGKPFLLYSSLPYYSLSIMMILGTVFYEIYHTNYIILGIVFIGFPLLDMLFPKDWLNPDKTQAKEIQDSFFFKFPLYFTSLVGWVLELRAIYWVSKVEMPIFFYPGFLLSIGNLSGVNFMIAHELFHKPDMLARVFGTLTMSKNFYMHFFIEHNWGHHKRVATREDPATSREGESIFSFLPRSIIGSYLSAWEIENERLVKHRGYKTAFNLQNRMIWFTVMNCLLVSGLVKFLGWSFMIHFVMVGFAGIVVLEAINYIEHYGLQRKKISENEYERVTIMHSWNAPHRFTNYLLFKLQRHSDHHENAYKPYQTLLTLDQSPMLPHGYSLCLLASFFPKFWMKMMDPCLKAHREGRKLTIEEMKMINMESYKVLGSQAAIFAIMAYLEIYQPVYISSLISF